MATITAAVLRHQQRKDGSYPVRIRVNHCGKDRWLKTDLSAGTGDLTRSLALKGQLKLKTDGLLQDLRRRLAEAPLLTLQGWNVDQVVDWLEKPTRQEAFKLDFFEYGLALADKRKQGTGDTYRTALAALRRFHPGPLDINDIRRPLLQAFVEYSQKDNSCGPRRNPIRGTAAYVRVLQTIFRAAQAEFNDPDADYLLIPKNPFASLHFNPGVCHGESALTVEEMQALIELSAKGGLGRARQRAVDMCVLSFALMGANMADIEEMMKPDKNGVVTYFRKKVRDKRADRGIMKVMIPNEVGYLLRRYKATDGHLIGLHGVQPGKLSARVGTAIANLHEIGVLPGDWTPNAVRKAWATIARSKACRVDKATVDDALNHRTMALADIYIERDYSLFWEANEKVLSLFTWPK